MDIKYRFHFPGDQNESFDLALDPADLSYQPAASTETPEWTRLENNKCPNCPLNEKDSPHCPVARNLAPMISRFINRLSYEEVDVEVITAGREYRKHISLQKAISSLFGVVMSTSGCPVLDKMRPMVMTHLPFSELEEARYRSISMYLLAQLFRARKGLAPDWELKGLETIYAAVTLVNRAFIGRLHAVPLLEDASLNAIIGLDCFCLSNERFMNRSLEKLERLFQMYL